MAFTADRHDLSIVAGLSDLSAYKALYDETGWSSHWHWTPDDWHGHLEREDVSGMLLCVDGRPAGLFELRGKERALTEIYYFCIATAYRGRGLSRPFLRHAVTQAYNEGAGNVWLKTSSTDHLAALPLYLSEGFYLWDIHRTVCTM
ncbi:GNAT family N-acetyltransferase [Pseudomonas aeruginosa]|uniref:GNAT family N-acetyltransferase n=1 Tax=Pseudomonas aeruginosa TaxID=287 RepID=UPI00188BA678|nr:GNAT family N-acetyltransferase [Pseudomonas aeruginosa]